MSFTSLNIKNIFFVSLFTLPVSVYVIFFALNVHGIPINDDFYVINEIIDLKNSKGIEFWSLLFSQWSSGDYRHVPMRLIGLFVIYFFGINLIIWIVINQIFLFWSWKLVLNVFKLKLNNPRVLPISFLFFSPVYIQVIFFMTGSSTHLLGFSLSILAIFYSLQKEDYKFYFGIALTGFSVLHVSGLLIYPIIIFYYLFVEKNYKRFCVYLIILGPIITAHLLTFHSVQPLSGLNYINVLKFALSFLGSAYALIHKNQLSHLLGAQILGAIFLVGTIYFAFDKKIENRKVIISWVFFVFLLAFAGGTKRVQMGVEKGLMSGYSIHSVFLITIFSAIFLKKFELVLNKKIQILMLFFSIIITGYIYYAAFFNDIYGKNKFWHYKYYTKFPKDCLIAGVLMYPNQTYAKSVIDKAIASNTPIDLKSSLSPSDTMKLNNYSHSNPSYPGFNVSPLNIKSPGMPEWSNSELVEDLFEYKCLIGMNLRTPFEVVFRIPEGAKKVYGQYGINKNDQAMYKNHKNDIFVIEFKLVSSELQSSKIEKIKFIESQKIKHNFLINLESGEKFEKLFITSSPVNNFAPRIYLQEIKFE